MIKLKDNGASFYILLILILFTTGLAIGQLMQLHAKPSSMYINNLKAVNDIRYNTGLPMLDFDEVLDLLARETLELMYRKNKFSLSAGPKINDNIKIGFNVTENPKEINTCGLYYPGKHDGVCVTLKYGHKYYNLLLIRIKSIDR